MDAIPPSAHVHRPAITREAQFRFGIPAPVPAIAGQITQESMWNPVARSPVGAQGLMQFMPKTAEWFAPMCSSGEVAPLNPTWAIRCGVAYDRWLYDRLRADSDCDRWQFALAAYNGGLGWVQKRQAKSLSPGRAEATLKINPGIHPASQRENEHYPQKILFRWQPIFASWGRLVCY